MCKIITIANQKGGVGKTVTCQHLAYALSEQGKRVLTVDFDPQINLTATLATNKESHPEYRIADLMSFLLKDEPLPAAASFVASHGRIDFIYGSKEMSRLESLLLTEMGTEHFLEFILAPLRECYDYIIIDTNRAASPLMVNALTATDSVLIPINPEFYSTEGLSDLITTVLKNKRRLNPKISFEGILFTMCDLRTNLYQSTRNDVEAAFKGEVRVFNTAIPRTVQIGEAVRRGLTVFEYDKASKAGMAYREVAKELLAHA
jgi:chromosome partitioning protein